MFTERRSVGLDVHARSVAAAAIDGVTGELFQSRANTGCEDGSRTGMTVARSHRVCIRDIGFDVDVGGLAVVEAPVLGRRSVGVRIGRAGLRTAVRCQQLAGAADNVSDTVGCEGIRVYSSPAAA